MTSCTTAGSGFSDTEGDFVLHDFRFASGETLPELKLHCTTLGAPSRDAAGVVRNAVLVLHGTGGSGRAFLNDTFGGVLFGPGRLLDAGRHYLILPDGIGHGRSSKPSDGMRARFPRYTYADMVQAQYRLVTEGLGVNHLRLVMGTSMGGMHTWMWGETHPQLMDALMPLASLPVAIAGRNRMIRRMVLDAIRQDPDWQAGDYREQPQRGLRSAIYTLLFMVSVPLQWQQLAPTPAAADEMFDRLVADYAAKLDANDMLYQFDARPSCSRSTPPTTRSTRRSSASWRTPSAASAAAATCSSPSAQKPAATAPTRRPPSGRTTWPGC